MTWRAQFGPPGPHVWHMRVKRSNKCRMYNILKKYIYFYYSTHFCDFFKWIEIFRWNCSTVENKPRTRQPWLWWDDRRRRIRSHESFPAQRLRSVYLHLTHCTDRKTRWMSVLSNQRWTSLTSRLWWPLLTAPPGLTTRLSITGGVHLFHLLFSLFSVHNLQNWPFIL